MKHRGSTWPPRAPAEWGRPGDGVRGAERPVEGLGRREDDPPAGADGRSLVLVGLMGAGKSSVGRRLAARLGVPFHDADREIERAAGRSIPDIFEEFGEEAFRDCERRVIDRLLRDDRGVLATGGGAFMDPGIRAVIAEHGISIWLRAELDTLVERTGRRNNRPLLKTGDPREILTRLMAERHPVYAEAEITVDSTDGPVEITVDRVIAALGLDPAAD